jgi:hypothetical protein
LVPAKLPYELAEMQSKAELQRATANLYDKGGAGALTAAAKAEARVLIWQELRQKPEADAKLKS